MTKKDFYNCISDMAREVNHRIEGGISYSGDLLHDGAWVAQWMPDTFWWIVRPHGTHIGMGPTEAGYVLDSFSEITATYIWNGDTLKKYDSKELLANLQG